MCVRNSRRDSFVMSVEYTMRQHRREYFIGTQRELCQIAGNGPPSAKSTRIVYATLGTRTVDRSVWYGSTSTRQMKKGLEA